MTNVDLRALHLEKKKREDSKKRSKQAEDRASSGGGEQEEDEEALIKRAIELSEAAFFDNNEDPDLALARRLQAKEDDLEARLHCQREEAERRDAELARSLEAQDCQALTKEQPVLDSPFHALLTSSGGCGFSGAVRQQQRESFASCLSGNLVGSSEKSLNEELDKLKLPETRQLGDGQVHWRAARELYQGNSRCLKKDMLLQLASRCKFGLLSPGGLLPYQGCQLLSIIVFLVLFSSWFFWLRKAASCWLSWPQLPRNCATLEYRVSSPSRSTSCVGNAP